MINVAHDTNMIRGTPVCVDLSRIGGGFVNEHKEHEEHEGEITRETLKTSPITHPLCSHPHKIHKGTRTTKGKRIHGRVHPKSHGEMGP